ncbi:hypothetical protein [Streptomyces sp. NPDC020917]|uniref:hypothetical protein n=1 Tax=Streptomyces sp. NPDC020917 TaxID=3365102 RepID=UPI0037B6A5DF
MSVPEGLPPAHRSGLVRSLAPLAAVVALGALATGCGSPRHQAAGRGGDATVPAARDAGQAASPRPVARRLPIEDYLIGPGQYGRIEKAESSLVGACLHRFGLSYRLPAPGPSQDGGRTDNRYGPVDTAVAARLGYHSPAAQDPRQPDPRPSLSPDVQKVLGYGLDAPSGRGLPAVPAGSTYHGVPIPRGGCLGEADAALTSGGGRVTDDQVAVDINVDDYTASMNDPKVRAVFSRWSACMKDKGYAYRTPLDANNDARWHTAGPSAAERSAAVADAGCKARNDVVAVWQADEAADEDRDIRAHAAHLAGVRESIRRTLTKTDAVLRSAG